MSTSPPLPPPPPQPSLMKAPKTLADALEEAQQKVSDLLQHPDDLTTKLSQLKSKFASEKASIDAILKTNVQSQLDDTFDGLNLLSQAKEIIENVKGNLGTIDAICLDNKNVIINYQKIKKTRDVVLRFQALNKDIERLTQLIDQDSKNILGEAPNLLTIHYDLFRLEEFKDHTMFKAKSQGPGVVQIVTKYFKKLDALSDKFKDYLWDLARHLLDLIKENQGSVVVRVGKIIEAEENADERVLANEQMRTSQPQLSGSSEWRTMDENPRTVKNYRSQFLNAIHEVIADKFHKKCNRAESDVAVSLENAGFVFEDLSIVLDELGPRFPPKYNIFHFHVIQYHKHIYDLLNRLVGQNLETRDILLITAWVRDYYRIMQERLNVSEDMLEPRLLDDNEASLINDYVKLIRTKLMEWVDRLLDAEKQDFTKRDKPPETDNEGIYHTSVAVILFQMINQQLDVAIDAARGGRLLLDVAAECFQIMKYFQEAQLKMLEAEETRFLSGKEELPMGFPEYVISLSNNHLKCSEFMESLQKRLENQLDEKHRADFSKIYSEILDGFMKVAKRGYQTLIFVIFKDISPAMTQLFTANWYEQQLMAAVIHTLEDYCQDFKKHLQEYLFSKLTSDCMDRFLLYYLDAIKNKQAKFKMPKAYQLAKSDVEMAIQFWSEYKSPKRVKQSFDLVEKILGLLECSSSMIFLSWYSLWKSYNDIPMQLVEDLLYKRDDLEKQEIKEQIANCKTKAKEGNPEAVVSLFSRLSELK